MVNMGTPLHPEGVPHWTIKTQVAWKLWKSLNALELGYGGLGPYDLRDVKFPIDTPASVERAFSNVAERPSPIPGNPEYTSRPAWACVVYWEPPHEGCEGGPAAVNILKGMRGGWVGVEQPFRGFQPDITLYDRKGQPACFLEFVATSPPSPQKVEAFKKWGIPAFAINGNTPEVITGEPMPAQVLEAPCRDAWREEVKQLNDHMKHPTAFVGLRIHESNAQQYIVGEHEPYASLTWHHGETQTFGLTTTMESPFPKIKVVKTKRSISQDLFVTYLILQASLAELCDDRGVAQRRQKRIVELLSRVNGVGEAMRPR